MLRLASDDFSEFTSLSALAAASAKSKQTGLVAVIGRAARRIAPFSFLVECCFNIAMGLVRGGVTTEIIPCSIARVFVVLIVALAFLYSCVVLPKISPISTFVDVLVNLLVCISGLLVLVGAGSTATVASTAIMVLATLSLSVSATRMFFIFVKTIQLYPINEKGGVDAPGGNGDANILLPNSGTGDRNNNNNNNNQRTGIIGLGDSINPDGGGDGLNNRTQRAASTMEGADGVSGIFLLENLISVFGGGRNNGDDDEDENGGGIAYSLGGAPQEMRTINPNLRVPAPAPAPVVVAAAASTADENALDLNGILDELDEGNDEEDADFFNLDVEDNNNNNNQNDLNNTIGAQRNEELERRQRELENFLGVAAKTTNGNNNNNKNNNQKNNNYFVQI